MLSIDKPINLLIIEEQTKAEHYTSVLRSHGLPLRSHVLTPEEEYERILTKLHPDIVLLSNPQPERAVAILAKTLAKNAIHSAIIAITDEYNRDTVLASLRAGARDCVARDDTEYLCAIVEREWEYVHAVNQQKLLQQRCAEIDARAQLLMNHSNDAIAYIHQGMHISANHAYLALFNIGSPDDIISMPVMDLIEASQHNEFKKLIRQMEQDSQESTIAELDFRDTEGNPLNAQVELSHASIEGESCIQVLVRRKAPVAEAQNTDITSEQTYNELDRLTGLLNRQVFLRILEETVHNFAEKHYTLLLIGLQRFDAIERQVGLVGSDEVIAKTGHIIKQELQEDEYGGRYGDCKYLVLIPTTNHKQLKERVNNFIQKITNHIYEVNKKSIKVQVGIGGTMINTENLSIDTVLSRAIEALYECDGNQNQFHLYQPRENEMTLLEKHANWINRVTNLLAENKVRIAYNPIVKLENSDQEYYEIGLELIDEKGKTIPIAEYESAISGTEHQLSIYQRLFEENMKLYGSSRKEPITFFVRMDSGILQSKENHIWLLNLLKRTESNQLWILGFPEDVVLSYMKQAQMLSKLLLQNKHEMAIENFGQNNSQTKQLLESVPVKFLRLPVNAIEQLATEDSIGLKDAIKQANQLERQIIIRNVSDAAQLSTIWQANIQYAQGPFFESLTQSNTMQRSG